MIIKNNDLLFLQNELNELNSIKKFGYICKTKANIHIYKKG